MSTATISAEAQARGRRIVELVKAGRTLTQALAEAPREMPAAKPVAQKPVQPLASTNAPKTAKAISKSPAKNVNTTVNVYHGSATPQTIALPAAATPPTTKAPVKRFAAGLPARIAEWRSRGPQRKAGLAAMRIIKASGMELSPMEAAKMARENLSALVAMAKSASAWSSAKPDLRAAIEAGVNPPPAREITCLADVKASLSPAELKQLPAADRLEILTGVFVGGPKKLSLATKSAVTPQQTATGRSNLPEPPLTAEPRVFKVMTGLQRWHFKRGGGTVRAEEMSRDSFSKLNPTDRMKFIKAGGKITE